MFIRLQRIKPSPSVVRATNVLRRRVGEIEHNSFAKHSGPLCVDKLVLQLVLVGKKQAVLLSLHARDVE